MTLPLLYDTGADGIATITLNRPESRNAISPELACRLADALKDAAANDAVRVVILTGAGDRAFCAGGDLGRMLPLMTGARAPEDAWDRRVLEDPEVLALSSMRGPGLQKPVIAAVNGPCMAGGMETMLATDIRIAADHATFALPEARRGLIPFAGALVRLPRQIPHALAMEMLMTGDPMDAETARAAGLVNRVVPFEELMDTAREIAGRIAANGPLALREIKATVQAAWGRPMQDGFALEDAARDRIMASADAREGPRAFMEKRAPRFRGT